MSDVDPLSLLQPAATRVRDPISGRSVWLSGLIQNPAVQEGRLHFELVFTPQHTEELQLGIQGALRENLRGLGFDGAVRVASRVEEGAGTPISPPPPAKEPVRGMSSGGGVQPHGGPVEKQRIGEVKHVIVVASGKGGVGKSTISTNLAVALQRQGFEVGLLDADIYGPSLPKMMNLTARPMVDDSNRIIPPTSFGVRCLSIGLLVPEQEAIIWRGPMVMSAVRQFLQDTNWGALDYLIVDLPPGTGDAQLTLIQGTEIAGAVIVTTPQDVALADAVRGVTMFRRLDVPVLGIVENMAFYALPDGTRDHIFGEGGGKRLAQQMGVDLLAEIPLQTALRKSGDQGLPAALGEDALGASLVELAKKVAEKVPVEGR